MIKRLEKLQQILKDASLESYSLHSRVHSIQSFDTEFSTCFVKREDELSFGISGSKIRKYASLLPYLKSIMPIEVALVGGSYSNHILSLSQLLKQNRIPYTWFVLGEPEIKLKGTAFFSSLITEKEKKVFLTKDAYKNWDKMIEQEEKKLGRSFIWIPIGANMKEAFIGSLTLALDILKNEQEMNTLFDHIFVDSGTGLTSSALILALHYLCHPAKIYVVQMFGKEKDFRINLSKAQLYFEELIEKKILTPDNFFIYTPRNALSYGSVNQTVLNSILQMARAEGIFLDPVYNSKLFHEGNLILKEKKLTGNILFIHSGGALSLCGFQDQLQKLF